MRSVIALPRTVKGIVDIFVYLSVALGLLLLVQTFESLPAFVFRSIMIGWLAYLLVAIGVARGSKFAYPGVLVLAILTLSVSLPQRTHYALIEAGQVLGAFTFLAGSILQASLLILVPFHLWRRRKK